MTLTGGREAADERQKKATFCKLSIFVDFPWISVRVIRRDNFYGFLRSSMDPLVFSKDSYDR